MGNSELLGSDDTTRPVRLKLSMNGRGQTANDYLIGIILLLITITTVFGFFPSIYEPFEEPVSDSEETMVENLADEILQLNSTQGTQQTVNLTGLQKTLEETRNDKIKREQIAEQAGIPDHKQWNVTIREGDTVIVYGGDNLDNTKSPTATIVRFVKAVVGPDCTDGCWFIVQVW